MSIGELLASRAGSAREAVIRAEPRPDRPNRARFDRIGGRTSQKTSEGDVFGRHESRQRRNHGPTRHERAGRRASS
jgi:hypothetical protein